MTDIAPDVLVVGNGVIGLSIALELSSRAPDLRVTVIGPADRPGAATTAAGAMLNCFAEVTADTARHPATAAKLAIARTALDQWPRWLERLREAADDPALGHGRPEGTFVVLGAKAADQTIRNYDAILAAVGEYGEPHEHVRPADIPGLDPDVNARPVRALRLPREGAIDARAVLTALEVALRRRGVELCDDTVRALESTGAKVRGVRTRDGRPITAGTVVLAAGSLTQRFIGQLPPGMIPPMLHGAGFAVETTRERFPGFVDVVRTPNQAGACGIHLVPLRPVGREYIGATNIVSFHPIAGPRMGVCANLLNSACEQLDRRLSASQVRHWRFGRRPVPLDGLPLLGVSPSTGLVFATGTYRDGLHDSPVIARHIADVILDGRSTEGAEHFEPFTPERAPIEVSSVEASIDDFVTHEIDAAQILGIRLPYTIDPDDIHRRYRQTATEMYDRLGEPVALLPEVLNGLNNEPAAGTGLLAPYLAQARALYGARAGA